MSAKPFILIELFLNYYGDYMPKILDIIEVKKVIEDKFKQLYSDPHPNIKIQHAERFLDNRANG